MRTTLPLVVTALLLMSSYAGCASRNAPPCELPKAGQVLSICGNGGTVIISLGARDGVRPGDTLGVERGGRRVATLVIHQAEATQAAGSAVGVGAQGAVRPGDVVIPDK